MRISQDVTERQQADQTRARLAAIVSGWLWSCMLPTLLVPPAAYALWRRYQVRAAQAA